MVDTLTFADVTKLAGRWHGSEEFNPEAKRFPGFPTDAVMAYLHSPDGTVREGGTNDDSSGGGGTGQSIVLQLEGELHDFSKNPHRYLTKHKDYAREMQAYGRRLRRDLVDARLKATAYDLMINIVGNFPTYFRYCHIGGIRDVWNFFGALKNTDKGKNVGNLGTASSTSGSILNVVVQKDVGLINRWGNDLPPDTLLWIILKRAKYEDGTYGEYQFVPWYGKGQTKPGSADLFYRDVSGSPQLGHPYYVGRVKWGAVDGVPVETRRLSWGIGETTADKAFEEKGKLTGKVGALLRV